MDNFSSQQGSETQKPGIFSATLQLLDSIENGLAGLFELTEEEQEDAGLRLEDKRYE
jgi:hypothetical protein